jgi:hypothetical protein
MAAGPALVFIISDSIRGHLSQSRGIAGWLSRFTGADIVEMDAPLLSGKRRVELLKVKARHLPKMNGYDILVWLDETGASFLFDTLKRELAARKLTGKDALFLAAGGGAAPFALALAKMTRGKSCVLMTPSVLGTAPFDFAVVPAHDYPRYTRNLLATLGAPNAIFPDELERKGWELAELYAPGEDSDQRWGVLVGGDDANYALSAAWVRRVLTPLFKAAAKEKIDLYVTSSRRTTPEAEKALKELASAHPSVRMLLLASKDDFNPVAGMLGLCSRLFVTEDSVSMVSEAITAGREVFLLRVEKKDRMRAALQNFTARLVRLRLLPHSLLWGKPKFDALFAVLERRGFLKEMQEGALLPSTRGGASLHADGPALNEARRAAEWIVERWKEKPEERGPRRPEASPD